MRPARFIILFVFAAAVAVTGCTARAVVDPSASPAPAAKAPTATTTILATPPAPTLVTPRQAPTPTPAPPRTPTAPRTPAPPPRLHFSTPQAAMRYLTAAYNRNDLVALGHVTTPIARVNLVAMHRTAVNLQLIGCSLNAVRGDYLCTFRHDYPAAMHLTSQGHAHFTAAPADKFGWYMTVLNDCS
jgi:hypothetical protein